MKPTAKKQERALRPKNDRRLKQEQFVASGRQTGLKKQEKLER